MTIVSAYSIATNVYSTPSNHWFITVGDSNQSSNSNEQGWAIISSGGNLYITGTTNIKDSSSTYLAGDVFLAKVSPDYGTVSAFRVIGNNSQDEYGRRLTSDSDGNIYVIGYVSSTPYKILLAKFDSSGSLVWAECISGVNEEDYASGLGIVYAETSSGGKYLYIAGAIDYNGKSNNLFIAKIDVTAPPTDNIKMFKVYLGVKVINNYPIHMAFTSESDGDYIYLSTVIDNESLNSPKFLVLKLKATTDSSDGDVVWHAEFGKDGSKLGLGGMAYMGKFLAVSGSTNGQHLQDTDDSMNAFIVYISTRDGSYASYPDQFISIVYGTSGHDDLGNGIVYSADDGNLYVTGSTSGFTGSYDSDAFVAGVSDTGNINWMKTVGGDSSDLMRDITIGSGDYLYTTGYTYSFGQGGSDLPGLLASQSMTDMTWTGGESFDNVNVTDVTNLVETGKYDFDAASYKYGYGFGSILSVSITDSVGVKQCSFTNNADLSNIKTGGIAVHKATDSNTPDPVPEPWLVSMVTLGVLAVAVFLFSKRH